MRFKNKFLIICFSGGVDKVLHHLKRLFYNFQSYLSASEDQNVS